MLTRFAATLALAVGVFAAGGASAQTYYQSDRILHHYDPFDAIPGTEVQGGIGSGLAPSPARPLVVAHNGVAVYAATNPLVPGPIYMDPRRYGRFVMSPYERRLYFAKDPVAYARRHPIPEKFWPGEATNQVVGSTGYREDPKVAKRAYKAALRGHGVDAHILGPDGSTFFDNR